MDLLLHNTLTLHTFPPQRTRRHTRPVQSGSAKYIQQPPHTYRNVKENSAIYTEINLTQLVDKFRANPAIYTEIKKSRLKITDIKKEEET